MAAQLLRDPPEVRQYTARGDPPLDLWPGHISVLEPLGLTVTRAAEGLGVTRQALSELVNERSGVSVEMSIGLSQAFGSTPETWLGLADGLRPLAGAILRQARGGIKTAGPQARPGRRRAARHQHCGHVETVHVGLGRNYAAARIPSRPILFGH